MGATSSVRDLFIEVGAHQGLPGTTYGSADAPFSPTLDQAVDDLRAQPCAEPRGRQDARRFVPRTRLSPTHLSRRARPGGPAYGFIWISAPLGGQDCINGGLGITSCKATSARGGELITEVACVDDRMPVPGLPGRCQLQDRCAAVSRRACRTERRGASSSRTRHAGSRLRLVGLIRRRVPHALRPQPQGTSSTTPSTRTLVVCRKRIVSCRMAPKIKRAA